MPTETDSSTPVFHIFECDSPTCRFRYPLHALAVDEPIAETMPCPLCKETASLVSRFDASTHAPSSADSAHPPSILLEVLLDNVRSVLNVGSIFRSADGAGVRHLHLCGITPTPEHPKLSKTALGAEEFLEWTYYKNGLHAVKQAKVEGKQIWGLEHTNCSKSLDGWRAHFEPHDRNQDAPLMLVMGNELSGIDPDILQQCDQVFHLPMRGAKRSLNVAVAFGIAAYLIQL